MTKEEKNSQVYRDCLEGDEPSMPDDDGYMESYLYLRAIADNSKSEHRAVFNVPVADVCIPCSNELANDL